MFLIVACGLLVSTFHRPECRGYKNPQSANINTRLEKKMNSQGVGGRGVWLDIVEYINWCQKSIHWKIKSMLPVLYFKTFGSIKLGVRIQ